MSKQNYFSLGLGILVCYLFPAILLSTYTMQLLPLYESWKIFSYGIAGSIIGALVLFVLLNRSESDAETILAIKEEPLPVENDVDEEHSQEMALLKETMANLEKKCTELSSQLVLKDEEIKKTIKNYDSVQDQIQVSKLEFATFQKVCEEQLQAKDDFLQESQQASREQRLQIEKLQQHIAFLESKERDLHYEIKTLLQLTSFEKPVEPPTVVEAAPTKKTIIPLNEDEEEEFSPAMEMYHGNRYSPSSDDARNQLKRFIDTATKMTGAHYFGSTSGRLPMDNYVLDLRRLFDGLSDEYNYIVIVYSQRDNKILFSNQIIKNVLGWSSEKFVQNFSEIMQDPHEDWKKAIGQLTINPEVQLSVSAKTKTGKILPLQCHLGAIYTGLFKNHAIGVMYPKV